MPAVSLESPDEGLTVAECDAPRSRLHLVDRDGERLARPRAADLDRPVERVPGVQLAVALEELRVLLAPAEAWVQEPRP